MLYHQPFPDQPIQRDHCAPDRLDVQRQHLQHQRQYYEAIYQQPEHPGLQRHDRQPLRNAIDGLRRRLGQRLVIAGNWINPDCAEAGS